MPVSLNPIGTVSIIDPNPEYKPYFVNLHRKDKKFYVLSGVLDGPDLMPRGTSVTTVTYVNGKVNATAPTNLSETHTVVAIYEIKHLMYGGSYSSTGSVDFSIKIYDILNNFHFVGSIPLPLPSGINYPLTVVSLQVFWHYLVVGADPARSGTRGVIYIIDLNDTSKIRYYFDDESTGDGVRNFTNYLDKVYWVTYNSAYLSWVDIVHPSTIGGRPVGSAGKFGPFPDGSVIDRTSGRIFIPFDGDGGGFMAVYDITVTPPVLIKEFPISESSTTSIDIDPFNRLIYLCGLDGGLVVVDSKAENFLLKYEPKPTITILSALAVHEYDHVVCAISSDDRKAYVYQQLGTV